MVEFARRACYGRNSFRGDNLSYRDRYFTETADGHQLADVVMARVRFLAGNLFDAHLLPNVLPSIVALLSLEMGIAVIVEAILSFVNLSISTDDPTWGGIIAEGRLSIHQAWWVLVFPLVTLFLTVLSFSQFGEGLKARLDPVLR